MKTKTTSPASPTKAFFYDDGYECVLRHPAADGRTQYVLFENAASLLQYCQDCGIPAPLVADCRALAANESPLAL